MKLVCIFFLFIPFKNFSQSIILKPLIIENSTTEFGDLGLMYKNVWSFDRKKRFVINQSIFRHKEGLDTSMSIYSFDFWGRIVRYESYEIRNNEKYINSIRLKKKSNYWLNTSIIENYNFNDITFDTIINISKAFRVYSNYYSKQEDNYGIRIDSLYEFNNGLVIFNKQDYFKKGLSRELQFGNVETIIKKEINPDCPKGEVIEVYNKNKDIQQKDQFSDGELFYSERYVYDKQNRLIFKGKYYPTDTVIETVEFIQNGDTLIEIRKEKGQFSIMKSVGLNQFYIKYSADSTPYQIGRIELDKKARLIRAEFTGVDGQTPIDFKNFLAGQTHTYSYPRKRFWCRELWK